MMSFTVEHGMPNALETTCKKLHLPAKTGTLEPLVHDSSHGQMETEDVDEMGYCGSGEAEGWSKVTLAIKV